MTGRHARFVAAVLLAAAALPGSSAAQSFRPQPQLYLLSADAADGRALWLQPAGLARRREASLGAFFTAERNGIGGVTQYGVTLSSAGLGLGWQHDRRGPGVSNNTWSFGFAAGQERAGIGVARSWFRGTNTSDGSFDGGVRYMPAPMLELSFVWRDIGSPVVLGDTIRSTIVPAAALNVLGGRARLTGEWELVASDRGTSAVRAGASVALGRGLVVAARADFDGSFDLGGMSVALSLGGGRARGSVFGTNLRGAADPFGAWLGMVQPLDGRRRRR